MIAGVAALSIAAFLVAFGRLRMAPIAGEAVRTSQAAAAAMRDPALDDLGRERAVQRASLQLLGHFFSLLLRGAAAVAVSFAPIAIAGALGLAPADAVLAFLMRWPAWLLATGLAAVAWAGRGRLWPTS